jgi:hypothetical protein
MREAACTMVWVDALDYAEATEVLAAGLYRCAELPAGHVCRELDSDGAARRP